MQSEFMNLHFSDSPSFDMTDEEVKKLLRSYDNFKTWGFIGDPYQYTPLNSFYLVPKKPITFPLNKKDENLEIDYRELSSVIVNGKESYFCCEYYYSFDEFRKTKYRGTFKIKICKANKRILDWIVKNRVLILMNKSPKTYEVMDMDYLLKYFSKNPSFILPLKDVSGLAFDENYLDLIVPK